MPSTGEGGWTRHRYYNHTIVKNRRWSRLSSGLESISDDAEAFRGTLPRTDDIRPPVDFTVNENPVEEEIGTYGWARNCSLSSISFMVLRSASAYSALISSFVSRCSGQVILTAAYRSSMGE